MKVLATCPFAGMIRIRFKGSLRCRFGRAESQSLVGTPLGTVFIAWISNQDQCCSCQSRPSMGMRSAAYEREDFFMFEDLDGKTALVTGASGGLGLHFARLLAARGVHVTLAARRAGALESACADIEARGGIAAPVALDVTDKASVDAAMGSHAFDIVINNAGISLPEPAIDMAEADWDRQIDTNLKGVFLVAQAAARQMREAGKSGTIVNIASILGLRVAGAVSAYSASKAAVIQLSKSMALEWARYEIRVNALCPGYIETDINREFFATDAGKALIKRIPQRRLGQIEELDGPLLLLCSQAGSYMTGSVIAADGGHLVSSL